MRRSHTLPKELVAEMEHQSRRESPVEACGILIGESDAGRTRTVASLAGRNVETERPDERYRLAPEDFLAAERVARRKGLDVVGFWHSHPRSPARPSEADRESAWVGYSYVIISLARADEVEVRSWRLSDGAFWEEEISHPR